MIHDLDHGKLKDAQFEELKKLFQAALADGRISTKEITQIQLFYYDSQLSEKDFSCRSSSGKFRGWAINYRSEKFRQPRAEIEPWFPPSCQKKTVFFVPPVRTLIFGV